MLQPASPGRRDPRTWLALAGILALLVVLGIVQARTGPPPLPYSLEGRDDQGLLLLRRWLEEQGYQVATNDGPDFHIPQAAQVFFVYPPLVYYEPYEADLLDEWIQAGGTAVIVGVDDPELAYTLDYETHLRGATVIPDRLALPLLPQGPATLQGQEGIQITGRERAALPVVVTDDFREEPMVSLVPRGAGRVWMVSGGYAFTNRSLALRGHPQLLLAILARTPPGSVVAFDTFHHQDPQTLERSPEVRSLRDWLYGTPMGWALLYTVGLTILVLAQQGRRLGPPLPPAEETARREAAEHVIAMAQLYRQAQAVEPVAEHLRRRLKRALARPWGLSPDLPDDELLGQLQRLDPRQDPRWWERVRRILEELHTARQEAHLVRLAQEIDALLTQTNNP